MALQPPEAIKRGGESQVSVSEMRWSTGGKEGEEAKPGTGGVNKRSERGEGREGMKGGDIYRNRLSQNKRR